MSNSSTRYDPVPLSEDDLIPIDEDLDRLEMKIDVLTSRVEVLVQQFEELMPAARRAAAMMDNSKIVKAREALDRWRSGRG